MSKTVLCDNLKAGLDRFRPFPPETLASLRNYYRVGLTWSSNALEDNSLTESETKVIIEDGLTVHGKPLHDVYEALGHADAYTIISTPWQLIKIWKSMIFSNCTNFFTNG